MALLSGFLEVAFSGLVFVGLALSIGGLAFHFVTQSSLGEWQVGAAVRKTALMIAVGAGLLAIAQMLRIAVTLPTLIDTPSVRSLAILGTTFGRAGILRSALALALMGVAIGLVRAPRSSSLWIIAAILGGAVLIAGAWLTHAASRMTGSGALMVATTVHLLAAAVWVGGLVHLATQWRLLRRTREGERVWLGVVARFSPMALISAGVLIGVGVYLSWAYIRDIGGLLGTAYGAMTLSKIALLMVLLLLGGLNFLSVRRWTIAADNRQLLRRTPAMAEVEAGVGVIILLAAAALTSIPPAIDITDDRASIAEVLEVVAPKSPRLTPTSLREMNVTASSSLDPFGLPTYLQRVQSNFNHNVSGVFVIVIGLMALVRQLTGARWARNWPLLFVPFALFLLIVGEPTGWPLGREGFFATLLAPEVLQHRLATLIVAVLGVVLWKSQSPTVAATRWPYLFPGLCTLGGALLLTHSHSVFALKWAYLIEVSHNLIGILAVYLGAAGWIELRLPTGREHRIAGIIWPVCLVLVGLVLLFYREITP